MKKLIENAMIVTIDSQRRMIDRGYILVEGDRIQKVEEGVYEGDRRGVHVLDGTDHIVIPGLVNAHTHSYAHLVKGTSENVPLEVWMLYVIAEGQYMDQGDCAVNAALGSIEMLKSGTTTFLDHLAQDLEGMTTVSKQYKQIGIRSILTPMFGDRPYADSLPEENVLKELGSRPHGPSSKSTANWSDLIAMVEDIIHNVLEPEAGIGVAVGPSGAQRCSDELLVASMELAKKYNLPWHTHLLESKAQEVTAQRLYGGSMVSHLEKLGILNEHVSFAHAVWVSEKDIELILNHGASVVHNPVSNLFLGSGIMPLIPLKEAGVNLALGTDGTNCSGSLSMFESMKLASILSNITTPDYANWMKATDILEMATLGGARSLGMDHLIGSIEVGKKADFVLLNKNVVNFVPLNNLIWQLVYGRADSAVESVFVNGKQVVKQQKITTIDEQAVYTEAMSRGKILLQKCVDDYKKIQAESPALYEMLIRVANQPTNKI